MMQNRKALSVRLRLTTLFSAILIVFSLSSCSVITGDGSSVSSDAILHNESGSFSSDLSSDTSSDNSSSQTSVKAPYSSATPHPSSVASPSEASSSQTSSAVASSAPSPVTLWLPDPASGWIVPSRTTVPSVSGKNLLKLLKSAGILPSSVAIESFSKTYGDNTALLLDLNESFTSFIKNCGNERGIMGCIVNTYLDAYNAEKILITVNKYTLSTSYRTYAGCLTRYSEDLQFEGNNLINKVQTTVTPSKRVALTFDDGPHFQYTWLIVDELRRHGAAATFFSVGNRLWGSASSAVKYAVSSGCEIGIHGYTHNFDYGICSASNYNNEIRKTAFALTRLTGIAPRLMRPIGGSITSSRVSASPYAVINWSVDSNDWRYKKRETAAQRNSNIDKIVKNVLSCVKDGDIILMHEIYGNSYEAFCRIIDALYADGYELVTVSELLNNPSPGRLYRHA